MEDQTQELQLVDPKEFGIEEGKALVIANSFSTKQAELLSYQSAYDEIIKSELTIEISKKAKELGNKLVKVRTGIAAIHKVEKAFYLAGGKFVDALKNKLTMNVEQMEEKLEAIEQHFVKLEADRKAKLKADRLELLLPYDVDTEYVSIEEMTEDQFTGFLSNNKLAFETKKENERLAELARIEADKKAEAERLERERLEAERIESQRLENDRLKKEAEQREKELEAERKRLAAEQAKKDAEQKAELERLAKEQAEKDRLAKIESDRLAKIAADEKAKSDKLAAELKAKQEAEDLALANKKARIEAEENEKIAKEKAAFLAPDKDKVRKLYDELLAIKMPEVQSEEAKAIIKLVSESIEIIRKEIIKESKKLI